MLVRLLLLGPGSIRSIIYIKPVPFLRLLLVITSMPMSMTAIILAIVVAVVFAVHSSMTLENMYNNIVWL